MLSNITSLAGVISLFISVTLAIGGIFAFRGAAARGVSDLQKDNIAALQMQNELQEKQIKTLEKKIERLESTLSILSYTLKKRRGLLVEISDEVVTLIDQRTGEEHVVQIHTGQLDKEQNRKEP